LLPQPEGWFGHEYVVKKLPIAEYSVVKKPITTMPVSLSRIGINVGGEYRDRTGDLLVANQALSQLS
jgi:hypothetical protein